MGILNQEQRQLRMGYSNQVFTAATQQEWPSHADRALFILPSGSHARAATLTVLIANPQRNLTTLQGVHRTVAILKEPICRCPDFIYIHS